MASSCGLLILLAATGSGCGDSSRGTTGHANTTGSPDETTSSATSGSTSTGTSGSSDTSTEPPPKVRLHGGVVDFQAWTPVVGAEICIYEDDSIPCATSDENGRYRIDAYENTDVLVHYAADGRFSKLRHVRVEQDDEDLSIFNMQPVEWIDDQFAAVGVTPDPAHGHLAIQVHGQNEGATVSLQPGGGEGPFYTGAGEALDPMLNATTSEGLGVAVFLNVPEGEYSMVVTAVDATCTANQTPGDAPSSALGRSVAGFLVENFVTCQ